MANRNLARLDRENRARAPARRSVPRRRQIAVCGGGSRAAGCGIARRDGSASRRRSRGRPPARDALAPGRVRRHAGRAAYRLLPALLVYAVLSGRPCWSYEMKAAVPLRAPRDRAAAAAFAECVARAPR
ncbi:hypothetical protein, partial [Burkholderia glumae]|uniref:hypothetical protein n=1 Tax=Burkholderia glumae TaxID=337 RepID=UPI001E51B6B7